MISHPHNGDDILAWLGEHADELATRFGVRRIGLFGSWARGESRVSSDIDLLVEMSPRFDAYMELTFLLEEAWGRPVDLVMTSALRPRLKAHILDEVRYAA